MVSNKLEKGVAILFASIVLSTGSMGIYKSFKGDYKSAAKFYTSTNIITLTGLLGAGLKLGYEENKKYKLKKD